MTEEINKKGWAKGVERGDNPIVRKINISRIKEKRKNIFANKFYTQALLRIFLMELKIINFEDNHLERFIKERTWNGKQGLKIKLISVGLIKKLSYDKKKIKGVDKRKNRYQVKNELFIEKMCIDFLEFFRHHIFQPVDDFLKYTTSEDRIKKIENAERYIERKGKNFKITKKNIDRYNSTFVVNTEPVLNTLKRIFDIELEKTYNNEFKKYRDFNPPEIPKNEKDKQFSSALDNIANKINTPDTLSESETNILSLTRNAQLAPADAESEIKNKSELYNFVTNKIAEEMGKLDSSIGLTFWDFYKKVVEQLATDFKNTEFGKRTTNELILPYYQIAFLYQYLHLGDNHEFN